MFPSKMRVKYSTMKTLLKVGALQNDDFKTFYCIIFLK